MGDELPKSPTSPKSLNLPTIQEADYTGETQQAAKKKAAKTVSLQLPSDEDFIDDKFVVGYFIELLQNHRFFLDG